MKRSEAIRRERLKKQRIIRYIQLLCLISIIVSFVMPQSIIAKYISPIITHETMDTTAKFAFEAEVQNADSAQGGSNAPISIYTFADDGRVQAHIGIIDVKNHNISAAANTNIEYSIKVQGVENIGETNESLIQYSNGIINATLGQDTLSSNHVESVNDNAIIENILLQGDVDETAYSNTQDITLIFDEGVTLDQVIGKTYLITFESTFPYKKSIQFYFKAIDGAIIKFGRTDNLKSVFDNPIEKFRIWSASNYGTYKSNEAKVRVEWDEGLRIDTTNNLVRDSMSVYNGADSTNINTAGNADSVVNLTKAQYDALSEDAKTKSRYIYLNIQAQTDLETIFYKETGNISATPIRAKVYIKQGTGNFEEYMVFPLPDNYTPKYDFTLN